MKGYAKNRNKKSSKPEEQVTIEKEVEEINETLSEAIQQDILNMLENAMDEARNKYPAAATQINTFFAAIGQAAEDIMTGKNKKSYDTPEELKENKITDNKNDNKEKKHHEDKFVYVSDDEEDDGVIDFGSEEDEDDDAFYEDEIIDLSEFDEDED